MYLCDVLCTCFLVSTLTGSCETVILGIVVIKLLCVYIISECHSSYPAALKFFEHFKPVEVLGGVHSGEYSSKLYSVRTLMHIPCLSTDLPKNDSTLLDNSDNKAVNHSISTNCSKTNRKFVVYYEDYSEHRDVCGDIIQHVRNTIVYYCVVILYNM